MRTLKDIHLQPRDRTAVTRAATVLKQGFAVRTVILFGSKARGDDDAESDIDLLVLMDGPPSGAEKQRMTEALFPLQLELGVVISKLVLSLEEWKNGVYQALPIRHAVDQEGVVA